MTQSQESLAQPSPAVAPRLAETSIPFYRDRLLLLVFGASLALYLLSMPKTVALEDDSIFMLAGYFNGISHPPGYPLYTLILHLFTLIPIGDIPARAHASSAFFAALACCSLFNIFCLAGLERSLSVLAALVFALTATFWSQAISTEVYSLNVFLNLGLLFFGLRLHLNFNSDSKPSNTSARDFALFSALLGLALCNHWPLTVLAAPAYLLLVARPFFNLGNKLIAVLPATVVVLIFYSWLYINNQSSPFINFSGKFADVGEFIGFVLRQHYASVDFQPTAGWADKLQFARDFLMQAVRELNLLLIFAGIGIYHLIKAPESRIVGLALGWAIFANSLLLVLLIDFDYSYLYSLVFKVYPIVSIAMLFVLAGFGMVAITQVEPPRMKKQPLVGFLLAALLLNLYSSLPQNYRHQYSWGHEYAQKILSDIPANAILFSDGEIELGLLSYFRFIKGQRPDIELYSSSALLLENRLFDYRLEDKKGFIEALVDGDPDQPFYAANNYYGIETITGTLYTEKLGKTEKKATHTVTSTDIELLMKWSSEIYTRDPWTGLAVAGLRQKAIGIMAPVLKESTDTALKEYILSSILNLIQSEADALQFLKYSIKDEAEIDPQFYQARLADIERSNLPSKQDDSHFVYIAALSTQSRQTLEHIHNSRLQACQNWFSPKNTYCKPEKGN
jgi:hypothetical protein